jgi:hypothetical protein
VLDQINFYIYENVSKSPFVKVFKGRVFLLKHRKYEVFDPVGVKCL